MPIYRWCQWLEQTSIGLAIRDSSWLFPVIETIHVLGIVLLVGSTGLFDLRLLGRGFLRDRPASRVKKEVTPWVWSSFAVMATTGVLMFSHEATKCYVSWFFRIKVGLLTLAGLNALIFELGANRRISSWDDAESVTPKSARIAAWSSLILWVLIVGAGRGIAYY
jgi:uncharacterized protein DUF6644